MTFNFSEKLTFLNQNSITIFYRILQFYFIPDKYFLVNIEHFSIDI